MVSFYISPLRGKGLPWLFKKPFDKKSKPSIMPLSQLKKPIKIRLWDRSHVAFKLLRVWSCASFPAAEVLILNSLRESRMVVAIALCPFWTLPINELLRALPLPGLEGVTVTIKFIVNISSILTAEQQVFSASNYNNVILTNNHLF